MEIERRASTRDLVKKIDDLKTDVVDRMARVEVTLEQLGQTTAANHSSVRELEKKFEANEGYVRGFFKFGSILAVAVGLIFSAIKYFGS